MEGVRRRLRVPVVAPVFDSLPPTAGEEGKDVPRRTDVYSSNAVTADLVKVALNIGSTRPALTRFVVRTGATFQRLRTTYFEDAAIAMSLQF